MTKTQLIKWGELFTLELPSTWVVEEDGGVVTALNPQGGVGALNISIIKVVNRQTGALAISRELAESYARTRPASELAGFGIRTYGTDEKATSEFEYIEPGDVPYYWHVWHVVHGKKAAFITYTSSAEDASKESAECREIVESLSFLPTLSS